MADDDLIGDLYAHGTPLDPQGMFQLVTDEAYRNGRVGDVEKRVLITLARFLRLEGPQARAIADRSRKKYLSGGLGLERTFDPAALYRRVLRYVLSHGSIQERERQMLQALCKLFSISTADHQRLLDEARLEGNTLPSMPVRPRRRTGMEHIPSLEAAPGEALEAPGETAPGETAPAPSGGPGKAAAVGPSGSPPPIAAPSAASPDAGVSPAPAAPMASPRSRRAAAELEAHYPGYLIQAVVTGTTGEPVEPPFARIRKVEVLPGDGGTILGLTGIDPSALASQLIIILSAMALLSSFWWLL